MLKILLLGSLVLSSYAIVGAVGYKIGKEKGRDEEFDRRIEVVKALNERIEDIMLDYHSKEEKRYEA